MSDETNNSAPSNGAAATPIGMSNADLLSELDSLGDDPASAYVAKQAKGEERADAVVAGDAEASASDSEGEGGGDGDSEEAGGEAGGDDESQNDGEDAVEDEPEEPAEDKPDPIAAKRIEAIQKAEKESKARIQSDYQAAERQLEARQREWESQHKPRFEKVERYEKLVERLDIDPVSYVNERGWSDERKLYWAEQIFAEVKGKTDPKYQEHRMRRMREQEHSSKTGALEKELADTRSAMEEMRAEMRLEKDSAKAIALITDKTPALKHLLDTDKDFAEEQVRNAINFIRKQTNQYPDIADVIERLEEVEDREQKRRGVRRTAAAKAAPPPKQKAQEAGERKTAKTAVKNGNNKSPPPTAPPTRDDLIKGLEELERN